MPLRPLRPTPSQEIPNRRVHLLQLVRLQLMPLALEAVRPQRLSLALALTVEGKQVSNLLIKVSSQKDLLVEVLNNLLVSYSHGSADNINIITRQFFRWKLSRSYLLILAFLEFICDDLVNSCKANKVARDLCTTASTAAASAPPGGAQADEFNKNFGISSVGFFPPPVTPSS